MSKRKKTASEMTDLELERRVFPKPVLEELKRLAHEKDDPEKERSDLSQNKPST